MSPERSEDVLGSALPQGKAEQHARALLLDSMARLFEAELAEVERAHVESAHALKIHAAARAEALALRENLRASEATLKELTDEIFAVQREGDEEVMLSLMKQWAKRSLDCDHLRSKLATAEDYAAAVSTNEKLELDKLVWVVRSARSRAEKLRNAVEGTLEMNHTHSSKVYKWGNETGTERAGNGFSETMKFGGSVIVFSIMILVLIIGFTALGSALAGRGLP
ncbi:MAG: hypothetical protein JOZ19_00615 [Rubrobacter sp.]|nr:hypothetical protein [Rubrobacter sp.]